MKKHDVRQMVLLISLILTLLSACVSTQNGNVTEEEKAISAKVEVLMQASYDSFGKENPDPEFMEDSYFIGLSCRSDKELLELWGDMAEEVFELDKVVTEIEENTATCRITYSYVCKPAGEWILGGTDKKTIVLDLVKNDGQWRVSKFSREGDER